MKKIFINLIAVASVSLAFDFNSLSSNVTEGFGTVVSTTVSIFNNDKGVNLTNADLECKNPMNNYNFNYQEALKIAAMYSVSNSSSIMGFISGEKNNPDQTSSAIKQLALQLAKKTVWIPAETEAIYGQYIFEERKKNNDVILRTTKNKKYSKMYKKIDMFILKYTNYLKKNKYLENNEYPFNIQVYITSNNNQAEAIPGGYIFISEDYVKENRYGTALAHELTHISKTHLTKELQYRLISGYESVKEITKLINNIQDTKNTTLSKIDTVWGGKNLILQLFSKHSQEQELEADACSLRILTNFDYNHKEKYINELIKNIDLTMQNKDDIKEKILTVEEHPDKESRILNINVLSKTL